MKKIILGLMLLTLFGLSGCASLGMDTKSDQDREIYLEDLVDRAALTVKSMRRRQEFKALNEYLPQARGVMIFPSVLKLGAIYSGEGGNGVLLGRDENGQWSSPAFYTLGGGGWGLQAGVQDMSLVLVFMDQDVLEEALTSSVALGAGVSVAAGESGGRAEASSDSLRPDIYYFADVGGLFAGVSLEGRFVKVRREMNEKYYGRSIEPRQIIVDRLADREQAADLKKALQE